MNATADIDRLAGVLPLASIIPFPDLLLGGVLLVAVVLIHGIGIRLVSMHFRKRSDALAMRTRASIRLDVLLGVVVFLLLALHLAEVVFWTAALVYSRLVDDWRTAAFFAANTYTTVGYGKFVLPSEWSMMSPIISISGLFTFGWTGSVLVGFVTSLDRMRNRQATRARDETRPE
ncbi:MAG TPA: ion channel [Casimicrobiaceae bacterium]|nr:ion channel [Casimicrobiaceae bacterium]